MKKQLLCFSLLIILMALFLSKRTAAQCIVINEIMVNATTANSDGTGPNAGEWTELYNNCNTPIDISCWAFGDAQEFIAFIPPGTVIPPGGFYMIGSSNSGVPVDLNLGNCNCVYTQVTVPPGIEIGVFTNGNEQAVLLDDLGNYVDGVIWGGGQTPMNASGSDPSGNCGTATYNINGISDFPVSNQLPAQGGSVEDCTMSRICDGSSTWIQTCAPNKTPGASNGTPPTVSFTSTSQSLCEGTCINFNPTFTGIITGWSWNFTGGNPATSFVQNPTNICYNIAGNYNASVTVTSACGNTTTNVPNYITVSTTPIPVIAGAPSGTVCNGTNVVLSTTSLFTNYQWNLNGVAIAGETSPTLSVSSSGNYTVTCSNNPLCEQTSLAVVVNFSTIISPTITSDVTNVCPGQNATFSTTAGYTLYNFYEGTNLILTNSTGVFTASTAGNFSVQVSDNNGCTATSNTITITAGSINNTIAASGNTAICQGSSVNLSVATGYTSYQWYLDGTVITGETSNSINAAAEGNYNVEITYGNCTATSAQIFVTVILVTVPTISTSDGFDYFCSGNSQQLLCSTAGNLQWYLNGITLPGETSNNLFINQSGNYTVTLTETNGCTASSSLFINEIPSPAPLINEGSSVQFCANSGATINLDQNYLNVQWYFNNFPIVNGTGNSLNITSSGTYYAIVADANFCTGNTATINATINQNPIVSLSSPIPAAICNGQSITLTTQSGYVSYNWFLNGNSLVTNNSSSFSANLFGTYYVIVTDNNGCTGTTNNIAISDANTSNFNITSSTGLYNFCPGTSLNLNANPIGGFSQFSWFRNNVLLPGTNNANTISVNTAGWYKVSGTGLGGCDVKDSVEVFEYVITSPVISAPQNEICEGGNSVLITTNSLGANYSWNYNSLPVSSGTQSFFYATSPGNYNVIVTFSNGCSASSNTILLNEGTPPVFSLTATPNAFACSGDPILLSAQTNVQNVVWSSGETNREIFVFTSGNYMATAIDNIGCKSTESITVTFSDLPKVDAGPDNKASCFTNPIIEGKAEGNYFWSVNGVDIGEENLKFEFITDKTQTIVLHAIKDGCTATDTVEVKFEACNNLFIPNSFTPNGDNNNDVFIPIGKDISAFKMIIFNRFGEEIFNSTNINNGWDGTYQGTPCQFGLYIWYIEAYDSKENLLKSGNSAYGKVLLER
ncbi:MAG: gliding motility-associated C-terminal domain-containing protein [Bacteroidota bacterium]